MIVKMSRNTYFVTGIDFFFKYVLYFTIGGATLPTRHDFMNVFRVSQGGPEEYLNLVNYFTLQDIKTTRVATSVCTNYIKM